MGFTDSEMKAARLIAEQAVLVSERALRADGFYLPPSNEVDDDSDLVDLLSKQGDQPAAMVERGLCRINRRGFPGCRHVAIVTDRHEEQGARVFLAAYDWVGKEVPGGAAAHLVDSLNILATALLAGVSRFPEKSETFAAALAKLREAAAASVAAPVF